MQCDEIQRLDGSTTHPDFDAPVPENGYRWWYVDGMSPDGKHGIVIIAFVGSVFSPYYYRARQSGRGYADNFCAINVALYGKRASRWCMTERDASALHRGRDWFRVGPSQLHWHADTLTIRIHERSMPFLQPVKGTVTLSASSLNAQAFALDSAARHVWHPLAPIADIRVNMSSPNLDWQGSGYFDMNYGSRPLEADFRSWSWGRSSTPSGADIRDSASMTDGSQRDTHLLLKPNTVISTRRVEGAMQLPRGVWRVNRQANLDAPPAHIWDLEDTPFYTRSLLTLQDGQHTMHEYLDMRRFTRGWVRTLLPFRMPRRRSPG